MSGFDFKIGLYQVICLSDLYGKNIHRLANEHFSK